MGSHGIRLLCHRHRKTSQPRWFYLKSGGTIKFTPEKDWEFDALMSCSLRLATMPQLAKLVGGWALPLWKIWVRQLGWWHSQLNGKIKNAPNHQSVNHPFSETSGEIWDVQTHGTISSPWSRPRWCPQVIYNLVLEASSALSSHQNKIEIRTSLVMWWCCNFSIFLLVMTTDYRYYWLNYNRTSKVQKLYRRYLRGKIPRTWM